jgi:hypothetical protein
LSINLWPSDSANSAACPAEASAETQPATTKKKIRTNRDSG